ncbi:MAG: hypothetical protein GY705_08740 [Bacteroidetes bacterium]|nr:hypothetical protein [Bacteroidota bacterium]
MKHPFNPLDSITLLVLLVGIVQGGVMGLLAWWRKSGSRRSVVFYAICLLSFSFTLLHHLFLKTGFFKVHPRLLFLPIYYTLAFGPLLFFAIKLELYRGYRLVWSDGKHFILPLGQALFFAGIFLSDLQFKSQVGRDFYNPFYGAFEQLLFIISFFSYLYFSYRYIKRKQNYLDKNRHPDELEVHKTRRLKLLVKVLFGLVFINATFRLTDFIFYEFFNVNLQNMGWYAALGAFSFVMIPVWIGVVAFKIYLK